MDDDALSTRGDWGIFAFLGRDFPEEVEIFICAVAPFSVAANGDSQVGARHVSLVWTCSVYAPCVFGYKGTDAFSCSHCFLSLCILGPSWVELMPTKNQHLHV